MPKTEIEPLDLLRDARLSAYIISALPTWLWAIDGSRLLWANARGAAVLSAETPYEARQLRFESDQDLAQQVAQLATSLPDRGAPRISSIRGLGSLEARPLACICSRITLANGTAAVLVAATEPAGPSLSLPERVRRLFTEVDGAFAVFTATGELAHVSP